jgi:threonine dehydrogenase-like Zn-dependent dehydrogenase
VTERVEGGRTGAGPPASGRALYFDGPRSVRIERESIPDPDPDEVLVEATVSAVSSGTELLIYRGEMPRDLAADETIDALAGDLSYPLKYGYATVGDVVAVGSDVDDGWLGRTVFAFNPHESHFAAEPSALVPVPEDLSPSTAALLPTAETATTFVMDGRPRVGERGDPPGADLAYELSGRPTTLDDAIDAVGYDGRIVGGSWYGRKRAETDFGGFFHRNRIDVSSSQVSTLAPDLRGRWTKERRLGTAWERLRDVTTERLVTHRVAFEDAPEAYRLLDGGPENALQVLLTYGND